MGINKVRHPTYSPDLAPSDFCLFPKLKEKLKGCRYETIEEMKEGVTKVIDTLTQEDFHVAFQKLLERHNKSITAGWDYFIRRGLEFDVCTINKSAHTSGNLFNEPCTSNITLLTDNASLFVCRVAIFF